MMRCSAAWYEMNISAPDNIVSACCYYSGEKDPWLDEPTDIATYWNSGAMKNIRRLNGLAPPVEPNGCSGCFFFQNRGTGAQYFNFDAAPADLSPAQADNLRRARQAFETGAEEVSFTPLRIYANFGFACNLACTMCHQVPRRGTNRRQVSAASLLAWRDALEAALEVTVIGGEPFALPEAVAFIRKFIADQAFDDVRLTICTNGTVHHKHMDVLRTKRKLGLAISLDSIGEGYERIRVNGEWSVVERNLLEIVRLQKTERPEWSLQTNALILKSGIPLLPRFAEWHAKHGIITSFYDFINSRGTEDAFYAENVLHNPHLLHDMPDWEGYFRDAIATFRAGGLEIAATTLDHYRARLVAATAAHREVPSVASHVRGINEWAQVLTTENPEQFLEKFAYSPAPSAPAGLLEHVDGEIRFARMREGDHVATAFFALRIGETGGALRVRLQWPGLGQRRRAHIWLQSDDYHEVPVTYEISTSNPRMTEVAMSARLTPGERRIRLVAMPVGEQASILPISVQFELAGGIVHAPSQQSAGSASDRADDDTATETPARTAVAAAWLRRTRGFGRSVLRGFVSS